MLTDHFSLDTEWQQVSSSLPDSSEYNGRYWHCYNLDGLHSFSYFQVLQSLYQTFGDCTERSNYNWYHCHFHIRCFFHFPGKVQVFIPLLVFFRFLSEVCRDSKVHNSAHSLFFCWLSLGNPFVYQNSSLYVLFPWTDSGLFAWSISNFLYNFLWITSPNLIFFLY